VSQTCLLLLSTGVEFLEESGENLQARSGHVTELALVKLADGLIERF